jgi:hypothetical protein
MQNQELIFISYSKEYTGEVAGIFKTLLKKIYSNNNVDVFFSKESLVVGDTFKDVILEKLSKAKCGISLLSSENKLSSPWLMYEAGALSMKVRENGGKFLPFLFCRDLHELDGPLKDIHVKQYQPSDHDNLKDLIAYFEAINSTLSQENRISNSKINSLLTDNWEKYVNKELAFLADRMTDHSLSSYQSNSSRSGINDFISLHGLKTNAQDTIGIIDDFVPKTPLDIEEQFEKVLANQIAPFWKAPQTDEERKFRIHRIIVNDTRFSTFVCFTDGERIVLFDRNKDQPNTNVFNNRFDVFGSVQFENRTIKNKIKSKDFLSAPIEHVEEMPGMAIEDNRPNKTTAKPETAIMIGICIFMKKENLDLATNNATKEEICIYPIKKLYSFNKNVLTSKAALSLKYLLNR